jgi:glutamate transport system substrate-binding protein
MRVRTLAVGLLVGGLALSACGKEGSPSSGGGPSTTAAVETNVAVAGSSTFDKMKSRGKVIIGVKEDQPGLGYKDATTGKYSGFDIEIAKLVAAKLGFAADKIDFKTIPSVPTPSTPSARSRSPSPVPISWLGRICWCARMSRPSRVRTP